MAWSESSRRTFLKQMGAASAATLAIAPAAKLVAEEKKEKKHYPSEVPQAASRAARMKWWHQAKFGMFIHWGLYSVLGQHEWAMELEGVPVAEYEKLAKHFNPKPNAARDWAKLAKKAGMKYMVMTTKHHEGFCHWDSKLTNYNAMQQGPGRDLVREYVDAARAEGLKVGFYYSLMDWHHPDGSKCKTDEAARRRFVDYTHGLIRELLTNYGKIDVLWYDVSYPLDADGWESDRMNKMVFDLQPEIIVNNRNQLDGDFATPEQEVKASDEGRAWESCMTLNDSWGFTRNDDAWKTPKTVLNNLATCARDGGNYLLNIGPEPDGSIPQPTVEILTEVGQWLESNGKAIYGAERGKLKWSVNNIQTRRGNTLYLLQHVWPGHTPAAEWIEFFKPEAVLSVAGIKAKVLSVKLLKTGQKVQFTQDEFRLRLTGLPVVAPDSPVVAFELECTTEPTSDHEEPRDTWTRLKVNTSA